MKSVQAARRALTSSPVPLPNEEEEEEEMETVNLGQVDPGPVDPPPDPNSSPQPPATTATGEEVADDEATATNDPVPLPMRVVHASLVVYLIACFAALSVPLFSLMWTSTGEQTYFAFAALDPFRDGLIVLSLVLVMLGAIAVDFHDTIGTRVFLGVTGLVGVLAFLSTTKSFPAAPLITYLAVTPVVLHGFYTILCEGMQNTSFVFFVALGLLLAGVGVFVTWLWWIVMESRFWSDTDFRARNDFYVRLGCTDPAKVGELPSSTSNLTELARFFQSVDKGQGCDEAFIAWISPLVVAVWCWVLGLAAYVVLFLYRVLSASQDTPLSPKLRPSRTSRMVSHLVRGSRRLWITGVILAVLTFWAAASIAGDEMGMSSVVFVLSMEGLGVSAMLVATLWSPHVIWTEILSAPLARSASSFLTSDWLLSLAVLMVSPVLMVLLPASAARQLAQRVMGKTQSRDCFTPTVSGLLTRLSALNWTSILEKMAWWCVLLFAFNVIVARFLNVFFSFLNEVFVRVGFGMLEVTTALVVIGVVAFMIPVVPGLPVYFACGIVIVQCGMRQNWDFWASTLFATGVSWFIKIVSNVIIQKVFGERMGGSSVTIRYWIGVNSDELRAIKFVLLKPGLSMEKIVIFVGGPDWPTSVVAGILRMSLVESTLAALPVYSVIAPVVLAGVLITKKGDGGLWASAAAMAMSVAGMCQLAAFLLAVHYVQRTIDTQKDVLDTYEHDIAVAELEDAETRAREARQSVSSFQALPLLIKASLILSVALLVVASLFFQFSSTCFRDFAIYDKYDSLGGSPLNVVLWPVGWFALGVFGAGCLFLLVFRVWLRVAAGRARHEHLVMVDPVMATTRTPVNEIQMV